MAIVEVTVPYRGNYDYGVGVDLATSSPMGKVVSGEVSGVAGAGGAITSFEVARIHSTAELESKLGIDAEASYGSGLFGAGISARVNYARSSKVQASSLFMTISAYVTLEMQSIDDPGLTPAATELVSRPDVFSGRYGNMFVRGIGRGGLFCAVIQIDTSNSEDAKHVAADLEGSYGLFSASLSTKFDEVQAKYGSETRIRVYHEGGPIDLTMGDIGDPSELYRMMQAWLKSFQDDPGRNARPYYATLAPITIANGPPPLNSVDMQHAQDVLVVCAKQRSRIIDGMNLMDYIIQHPTHYSFAPPVTFADIVKASQGYQADLDLVAAAASAAMNDAANAQTPADFAKAQGRTYPLGIPPLPMPELEKGAQGVLAAKGQGIIGGDPIFSAMRALLPEGDARLGFDLGAGISDGHLSWGPGKQAYMEALPASQQGPFRDAADFAMERNNNVEMSATGARVATADPLVEVERSREPRGHFTIGFDVATALYGDRKLGALGYTATGPGAFKIRDAMTAGGRRGFNAGAAYHIARGYAH